MSKILCHSPDWKTPRRSLAGTSDGARQPRLCGDQKGASRFGSGARETGESAVNARDRCLASQCSIANRRRRSLGGFALRQRKYPPTPFHLRCMTGPCVSDEAMVVRAMRTFSSQRQNYNWRGETRDFNFRTVFWFSSLQTPRKYDGYKEKPHWHPDCLASPRSRSTTFRLS